MDDDKLKIAKKCAKYLKKLPGAKTIWNDSDSWEVNEKGHYELLGEIAYEEMDHDCSISLNVIFKKNGELKKFKIEVVDEEKGTVIEKDSYSPEFLKG